MWLSGTSLQTLYSKLASQDFINKQFATTVYLSLTIGMIPPIIYAMSRLLKTKQWNAELASINLQIRQYRHKIISDRQREISGVRMRQTPLITTLKSYLRNSQDLLNRITEGSESSDHDLRKVSDKIINYLSPQIDTVKEFENKFKNDKFKYDEILGTENADNLSALFFDLFEFLDRIRDGKQYPVYRIIKLRKSIRKAVDMIKDEGY